MASVAILINLNVGHMDADSSEKVAVTSKATPRINGMKRQST